MLSLGVAAVIAGSAAVLGGAGAIWLGSVRERMGDLMALGGGVLLGGALLGLVPAAVRAAGAGPLYVALGYLAMLAFRWLTGGGVARGAEPAASEAAIVAFAGLLLHTALDGAALGAAWHSGAAMGGVALAAVFLHKLPEGFSLAVLVMAATAAPRTALLAVAAVAGATVAGALLPGLLAGAAGASHGLLMGLAAGSFLYIGAAEVLPGVVRRREGSLWLVLAGVALVWLLTRAGAGGHVHVH